MDVSHGSSVEVVEEVFGRAEQVDCISDVFPGELSELVSVGCLLSARAEWTWKALAWVNVLELNEVLEGVSSLHRCFPLSALQAGPFSCPNPATHKVILWDSLCVSVAF